MKLQIGASVSAIAAAVMLASCASKGPVSAQDETPSEYRQLADNVSQQLVCRRQAVTGSRIDSVVCFTRAELKDQQQHALEVMRAMQESAALARSMAERPPSMPASPPRSGP